MAQTSSLEFSVESRSWINILHRLKAEYGDATYASWFKHLALVSVSGGEVTLSVPTRFIREWIVNNYNTRITHMWREENAQVFSVNILVRASHAVVHEPMTQIASGVDVSGQNILTMEPATHAFSAPLDRRFTFDNFVVGEPNRLAFAAAKAVATNTQVIPGNNPLYIYGGVGLGKTHLMHAIAWEIITTQPHRKVAYLSAERFMYHFVKALREKDIMSFKEQFAQIDVLIVDDVQFICGKESTQEEFHHTCNQLLDRNKQLIISGDRSPSDLEGMKERIRSRLGWGLVVDINTPSYDLRLGILQSKVNQMQNVNVPEDVLQFLAGRITSNTRELEGALNKVVATSTLFGKEITLDHSQSILSDLLRANERAVTIVDIQKRVADYYNIKMADMTSAQRSRSVARPRQIAMYLAKHHTQRSLAEIGRKFGGKDHTTVMHAVKKVEELSTNDAEIKEEINTLIRLICG